MQTVVSSDLDAELLEESISRKWDEDIVPHLVEYIRIPCKSPHFDPDWASNGHIDAAVALAEKWSRAQDIPGLKIEVHRLENRTPVIFFELDGDARGTRRWRDGRHHCGIAECQAPVRCAHHVSEWRNHHHTGVQGRRERVVRVGAQSLRPSRPPDVRCAADTADGGVLRASGALRPRCGACSVCRVEKTSPHGSPPVLPLATQQQLEDLLDTGVLLPTHEAQRLEGAGRDAARERAQDTIDSLLGDGSGGFLIDLEQREREVQLDRDFLDELKVSSRHSREDILTQAKENQALRNQGHATWRRQRRGEKSEKSSISPVRIFSMSS